MCLWGCFGLRLACESVDSEADCVSHLVWPSCNPLEVWTEEKVEWGRICSLSAWRSWNRKVGLLCSWTWIQIGTLIFLFLRLCNLDWNYTMGSPGCKISRWYFTLMTLWSLDPGSKKWFYLRLIIHIFVCQRVRNVSDKNSGASYLLPGF